MSLISGLIKQNIDNIYTVSLDKYRDSTKTLLYSNVPCRWEESRHRSLTVGADKLMYNVSAYILPTYTIKKDYLVEKDGETYTVLQVDHKYDITGNLDHYKVYLK